MGTRAAQTVEAAGAPLFFAFVFSVTGWALLELWLLGISAGLRAHGIAALFGLLLSFLSIRRPNIGGASFPGSDIFGARQFRNFSAADTGWAMLLLALGVIVGAFVLVGLVIVLGGVAVSLSFVPWRRVPFCRNHFLAACAAAWTGIFLVTMLGRGLIAPMFLPLACWVFWASASVSLLLRIEQLARAERVAKTNRPVSHSSASADTSA